MDVGLIPLRDTPFNNAKSELKMLEMGAKGIAVCVSGVYPYTNIAKNRENCLISHKHSWYKNIKELVMRPELRKELGEALKTEVIANWNNELIEDERIEFYKEVINGKVQ